MPVKVSAHDLLPEGKVALWKRGQLLGVWPRGTPVEDVDFDAVQFHPADFERLKVAIAKHNGRAEIIRALLANKKE